MQEIKASIRNLTVQMDQIARQIAERPTNTFFSDTIPNLKEGCKAINLRSEIVLSKNNEYQTGATNEELEVQEQNQETHVPTELPIRKEVVEEYKPKIPYPQRLREEDAQTKEEECMQAFGKKNLNAPPTFELKSSPPTLKYAFFDPSESESCMRVIF
ncbi:hypothetical protein AHAS_Ahas12G0161200 [Arachis hypogaea]